MAGVTGGEWKASQLETTWHALATAAAAPHKVHVQLWPVHSQQVNSAGLHNAAHEQEASAGRMLHPAGSAGSAVAFAKAPPHQYNSPGSGDSSHCSMQQQYGLQHRSLQHAGAVRSMASHGV
jgi:hypothetical protein